MTFNQELYTAFTPSLVSKYGLDISNVRSNKPPWGSGELAKSKVEANKEIPKIRFILFLLVFVYNYRQKK